jgi:hypothetical protein
MGGVEVRGSSACGDAWRRKRTFVNGEDRPEADFSQLEKIRTRTLATQ